MSSQPFSSYKHAKPLRSLTMLIELVHILNELPRKISFKEYYHLLKKKKFVVDDDTIIRNQRGDEIIVNANTKEELSSLPSSKGG